LFFDGHVKAVKVDPNDRVTGEYRVMFEESESWGFFLVVVGKRVLSQS